MPHTARRLFRSASSLLLTNYGRIISHSPSAVNGLTAVFQKKFAIANLNLKEGRKSSGKRLLTPKEAPIVRRLLPSRLRRATFSRGRDRAAPLPTHLLRICAGALKCPEQWGIPKFASGKEPTGLFARKHLLTPEEAPIVRQLLPSRLRRATSLTEGGKGVSLPLLLKIK